MKEYLSQRSVPFREVDVTRDAAGAQEMVRVSGQQGVPVIVIDGQVVVGFDRATLDRLLATAQRPRLGAAVASAAQMAAQGRTTATQGAYVGRVTAGGAAEQAGLRVGDVIVSLAGQSITDSASLEQIMPRVKPNSDIPLVYIRDNQQRQTTIRFGAHVS